MTLRIKDILGERGITAETLANDLGYNQGQVSRWLSGSRRAHTDFLEAAAEYLDLSVSDLFHARQVPVVGYIGAGAEFQAIDDHAKGGGIDHIEAPPGCSDNAVAVQVRGESMLPVYNDGDILIYEEQRRDLENFINRRVVCGLGDGRVLVKTMTRGSESGVYTLTSFNSGPITDVVVDWVARIRWVQPI